MNYGRGLASYPPIQPEARSAAPGLAQIQEALRRGLWDTAVRLAIGAGLTGVNQLTDTFFYLLHPELRGRRIGPSQRDLAREWTEIRDRRVRPVLESRGQPPSGTPARPSSVPTFFGVDTADWENQNADWARAKAEVPDRLRYHPRIRWRRPGPVFPPHVAEAQGRRDRPGRIPVPELPPQRGLAVQPGNAGCVLHRDGGEPRSGRSCPGARH